MKRKEKKYYVHLQFLRVIYIILEYMGCLLNPLSVNATNWSNTGKQFIHFVPLVSFYSP